MSPKFILLAGFSTLAFIQPALAQDADDNSGGLE